MVTARKDHIGNASTGLSQVEESAVKGGGLISGAEELSDSWRRCTAEHHIDPNSRTAPHIVTESEVRAYRELVGDIIFCAQEEINRLYAIVRQEGYVVLLCNAEGIAIHHRGDEARAEQFKRWGIWEGGVWAEKIEGTNGIGTCIVEQRPVSVHDGQHFRVRNAVLSCVAVPIFDARGVLAAVLDTSCAITARSDQSHALALTATAVSARTVEERLFRESFRHSWNFAAVPCDDSGPAVLLAVDNDQRVAGADRAARLAFALDDRSLNGGVHLSMLFEYDLSFFRNNKRQDIPARWMRAGGGGWWHVLITPPLSMWKGWRTAAEVATHSRPRISLLGTLPIPTPPAPHRGGLPPAISHRICEYIDSHLEERISLVALAAMAGLSANHFAYAFRQSVGLPPHSYLLRRRIETAQRMLRDTELPLSQIALAAGFSDYSHLARHFRRLTGMSPSALRWNKR